jgi:alkylhydroperoxidase family enzyme
MAEADEHLRQSIAAQRALYPKEYEKPAFETEAGEPSPIVAAHTLLPDALYHAFATFGVLMSPELPLTRRQHEMIATVVSVTNHCHY